MVCEYIQRMRQIEYDNITILLCKMISYRQVCNIRRTFVGNKIAYHSDIVGASPVGAAPTTSSFSTYHLALLDLANTTARLGKEQLSLVIWCALY